MALNDFSVLILGGTGAIGNELVNILKKDEVNIVVTTRGNRKSDCNNIKYVTGNAKSDLLFLESLLEKKWDCIVDFMAYSKDEFESRYRRLLESTNHYIFISSARVYVPCEENITESTPRLIDTQIANNTLNVNDYSLSKAMQEDLLIKSNNQNYTIIRPSITYGVERMQMGLYEKEEWLYRILHGRKIVLPSNLKKIKTSMTKNSDVAFCISRLILKNDVSGEIYNIANEEIYTWESVLEIYSKILKNDYDMNVEVVYSKDAFIDAKAIGRYTQAKYARGIDRTFNCNKILSTIKSFNFTPLEDGLSECLHNFMDCSRTFKPLIGRSQAYLDLLTNNKTALNEFVFRSDRIKYLIAYYTPYFNHIVHTVNLKNVVLPHSN